MLTPDLPRSLFTTPLDQNKSMEQNENQSMNDLPFAIKYKANAQKRVRFLYHKGGWGSKRKSDPLAKLSTKASQDCYERFHRSSASARVDCEGVQGRKWIQISNPQNTDLEFMPLARTKIPPLSPQPRF